MVVFEVKKVFPFSKNLLKEYFMCHVTWKMGMPYKSVGIKPREKNTWDWDVKDSFDFIVLKWNFNHVFTSIQIEFEDYLDIKFENSNQVLNFNGIIRFKEKVNEEDGAIKCLVRFIISKLTLKDPILNKFKNPFIGIMKADYKKFLDNVYEILQDKEIRGQVLEDCYWVDDSRIKY